MRRIVLSIVTVLILIMCTHLNAKQIFIKPDKVWVIVSPEESRDRRVLVYFNLPEQMSKPGVQIGYAVLVIKAQVTDADFGQVDVFPLTTEWKDAGDISWNKPWNNPGGDYSMEYAGRSTTLKQVENKKNIRLNITFMVMAWVDGVIENNGIMIVPSQNDLQNLPVEYYFDEQNILLKIEYDVE